MFLPAVTNCGHTIYPVAFPPVLAPYLVGLVLALAVIFHSGRAFRRALLATRLSSVGMFAVAFLMFSLTWWLVLIELGFLMCFWWALGFHRRVTSAEYQLSRGAACLAAAFIAWFSVFCFDPGGGALIGVWLSFASSVGLFIGAVIWAFEANDPHQLDI